MKLKMFDEIAKVDSKYYKYALERLEQSPLHLMRGWAGISTRVENNKTPTSVAPLQSSTVESKV